MTASSLHARGFQDLVSVIPPGAPLSTNTKIKPESRGKAPGHKTLDGWTGSYSWQTGPPDSATSIDRDKANIGFRADAYPAVDIDVKDETLANHISRIIVDHLPEEPPTRVGLWPKRLFVFRRSSAAQPFGKMQLIIPNFKGQRHVIEVLAHGQQYVVAGGHPSGVNYSWPVPLPDDASDLLCVSQEILTKILNAVEAELDEFGIEYHRSGDGRLVDRAAVLQGELCARNLTLLQQAMTLIPDDEENFPDRTYYLRMGYALRGATQKDPELGLQLWQDWTGKWPERNDPETVTSDWSTFHGPFELGADYIYEVARKFGFNTAVTDFDAVTEQGEEDPESATASSGERSGTTLSQAHYSDAWLKDLLIQEHGGVLAHVPEQGKWLSYDDGIWRDDTTGAVPYFASRICINASNDVLGHGATEKEKKEAQTLAKSLASSRQLDSVLKLARQDGRVIVSQTKFDADPDVIGVPGGAVDLRKNQILDPKPDLWLSKSTLISPEPMPTPLWDSFLDTVTDVNGEKEDPEFRLYLQRLAGYCLTGHVFENVLFFLWGEAKRGKSTFIDTLGQILGSYAKTAQMTTFISKKYGPGHPTDLAALAGSRLVTAQELEEGGFWDEARIKQLTGDDVVTARFMHKDEFSYKPTFKLLFAGNDRPRIKHMDSAMRRRIHLVPFLHLPKEIDLRFRDKLRAEFPGIFAWAVEGNRMWREIGLAPPACVTETTLSYFESEDPAGRWNKDCCQDDGTEELTKLYLSWIEWCDQQMEHSGTQRKFVSMLENRRLERSRGPDGRVFYKGISLKKDFVAGIGTEFKQEVVLQ